VSKSRIRVGAVAGALLLVGALTACSGGQPGAAAVVHEGGSDRVIPTSAVDSASRELATFYPGVSPAQMLGVLIQEPVFERWAEDNGAGVSPDQVDDEIARLAAAAQTDPEATDAAAAADTDLSDSARTVVRYTLLIDALNGLPNVSEFAADLNAELAGMDYTVSPRYGTENADGAIGATAYPWIVPTATDDAAATAQP
jgi:hypothetical protein